MIVWEQSGQQWSNCASRITTPIMYLWQYHTDWPNYIMTGNLPGSFQCKRCVSLCNMTYSAAEKADFLCIEFYVELAIEMFVSDKMNFRSKTYHLTGLVRNIRWFKTDITQKCFLTSMMHDITYTKVLPSNITCMMQDITCTRALPNVITCTGALPNVMSCIMHAISFGTALMHVISCMMHVITFGRALVHVKSCIMHVISCYACYACYNIRESSRACYIMHHACYNIRNSSCGFYIMHHAC